MEKLQQRGIIIINAAVFNSGFLIGEDYHNYKLMDPMHDQQLFKWRTDFFELCDKYKIKPAQACIAFGLSAQGVKSIALNAIDMGCIKENLDMGAAGNAAIPSNFWKEMKAHGLIDKNYTYV
ncbi:unnamed protein product [Rotaria sordida]|uniref:NADP-dependent oxidoreductase domain-containing protein n=1 Tax=Rotaria sordida TaxID=392033 RepID=A0A814U1U0_9BILA|nr:unnamed protein product [Rotaria sordida]CAF3984306.1 unnamed protein product [Rotaria sordida]